MSPTRYSHLIVATAWLVAGEAAWAQQSMDWRTGAGPSRSVERKEPLLLRNIFGKRKTPSPVPAGTVATAAAPGNALAVPAQPAPPVDKTGPGPAAVSGEIPASSPGPTAVATSESVAAAISKITGKSNGEMLNSVSKALDGNQEQLKTLARSMEGDPSKLVEEGRKLLQDPEVSASARQALEAVAKPGAANGKVSASSLEEVKHLAEKAAANPKLVSEGKQFVSENRELLENGKEFLKEKVALNSAAAKDLQSQLPAVRSQLAQFKAPALIPAAASMPSGPLPPWVGPGVPAPRDPVVDPIPRPEVDPDNVTKITAEFARFDANTNVVTFEENVELSHKEFDLQCQVLEAELKPGKDGSQADPGLAKAQAAGGGIRKATAKGFVIIQKVSADGKIQVAKSRQAIYDAESGDVILSDFPTLQSGPNLITGAEETTKIYLRKNGKYEVKGRADYEVVPEKDVLKGLPR